MFTMRIKVLAVIFAALLLMVVLHHQLDRRIAPDEEAARQGVFVPSVQTVQLASGGFDKLVADLYWLGFIQYCGEANNNRGKVYRRSYDYVDLITGLDPTFTKPYWFGCWAVGYWQKRPDLADKILQRGIAANPEAWDLAYLAGINQYLFARNYKLAAHYYRVASTEPNAPEFLKRQAQILESPLPDLVKRFQTLWEMYFRANDGNLKTSIYKQLVPLMDEMYRTAPNDMTRDAIKQHIELLKNDYRETVG